ncbi:unnamed protein product [Clavelina lepadiformis]|uniref:Uncharacterized protein n=1 Tax=Clavelina lepadiformis TaxID=159417 RepID=A0ABP0G8Z2_CLALP
MADDLMPGNLVWKWKEETLKRRRRFHSCSGIVNRGKCLWAGYLITNASASLSSLSFTQMDEDLLLCLVQMILVLRRQRALFVNAKSKKFSFQHLDLGRHNL